MSLKGPIAAVSIACCFTASPTADVTRAHVAGPIEAEVVVVAVAADSQAIAVRDESGRAALYARGETLGDSAWRLKSVHRDVAILETDQRFEGETLQMQVRAGQALSLRVGATGIGSLADAAPQELQGSSANATH
jgi:type II secretory pathway component PulC